MAWRGWVGEKEEEICRDRKAAIELIRLMSASTVGCCTTPSEGLDVKTAKDWRKCVLVLFEKFRICILAIDIINWDLIGGPISSLPFLSGRQKIVKRPKRTHP